MRPLVWLVLLSPALAVAAPPEPGPPSAVEGPTAQSPHLVSEVRFDTQVNFFKSNFGNAQLTPESVRLYRFGIGGSLRLGPVALDLDVRMHVTEYGRPT